VTAYDEKTALLVIDVQNDFASPDGALYVKGGEEIVPSVNREIDAARDSRALVVYTQDWHPPTTPHFAKDGGIWPVHCVRDTWGASFDQALQIADHVIRKGVGGEDGYSGFSVRDPESGDEQSTGLEKLLTERGITRVVVVGLALDYCVKATALDAISLGFATTLLGALTRSVDLQPGDGQRALEELERAGVEID
jgi:nicotinamidase/pyrazinamidase